MNSKFGMFSVLVIGLMMLLIPSTSITNAQEYYEQDQYHDGAYREDDYKKSDYDYSDDRYSYVDKPYKKKDDNKKSDEPVIIIKNEPIQKKEKKKEMKEPPMLIVKKDVLYCDSFSGSSGQQCIDPIPPPNSDRWLQICTLDNEVCDNIDEEFFNIILTDDIKFAGSKEGTKLNLNGERFTVTEEVNSVQEDPETTSLCQESGFDKGFLLNENTVICTEFEGECSGIVEKGELKECTVENYIVGIINGESTTTKLTVNKEIYGCDNIEGEAEIDCQTLENDNAGWILCDDLVNSVQGAATFCNPLQEDEFDIEVSDGDNTLIAPPGQFEGSTEGIMIMDLEPGTYNINEITHTNGNINQFGEDNITANDCMNLNFVAGGIFSDTTSGIDYRICFEYEDENGNDCNSIGLQTGDDKTCTVKNYILFASPPS